MLLLAALAACGGGGGEGGDSGTPGPAGGAGEGAPLVYAGNSAAAAINVSNANTLLVNAFGSGDATVAASGIAAGGQLVAQAGQIEIGRGLARAVRAALTSWEEQPRGASIALDETKPCAGGGTRRFAGEMSENRTGTLTVTWTNCRDEEGDVFNGSAIMRIDAYSTALSMATDMTVTFVRLSLRGASNVDLSGTVRFQVNPAANSETRTANIVTLDMTTGRMTKSENLVVVDTYDNLLAPSSYSETITGRVYDAAHGFVDITTPVKLGFRSVNDEFPSSGELRLLGAAGSSVTFTASGTVVRIAVDADGNGVFERQARLNWNDVGGPAGANLSDTDGDGMHDSWESVYGLDPAVPDHNGDLDGDGSTNLAEYLAGTRPNVR